MRKNLSAQIRRIALLGIISTLMLAYMAVSSSAQAAAPLIAGDEFIVSAHKLPAKVVKANGAEATLLADTPVSLAYGDKIVVGKGGLAELYYGHGLSVEAWQGAELVLSGVSTNQVNFLLLVGQIHAVVPPNSTNKIQLTTTYQVLTTTVDDTEFIICHDPNTKKLTCNDVRRGEVEIEANGVVSTLKGKYGAYTLEGKPMSEPICEHVDEMDKWVIQTRNAENVPPLGALVGRWYNEYCPAVANQMYVSAQVLPAKIIKSDGSQVDLQQNIPLAIGMGDKLSVGDSGSASLYYGLKSLPAAEAAQLAGVTKSIYALGANLYGDKFGDQFKTGLSIKIANTAKEPLAFDFGWCAYSQSALENNVKGINVDISFDNQRIPDSNIASYDYSNTDNNKIPLFCRYYFTVINSWSTGDHPAHITVTAKSLINDGKNEWPAGTVLSGVEFLITTP
jgi:hypothetical protein